MPLRLDAADPDFPARFAALLDARHEADAAVAEAVAEILAAVARDGEAAVLAATRRFDRVTAPSLEALRVAPAEIDAAIAACPAPQLDALRLAAARIEDFHRRHLPASLTWRDGIGTLLGMSWRPIGAVGLYVPGGTAAYPSSVLMNAIPARVAETPRVVMVTPAPDGALSPLVLAAARLGGVTEIWRIGGAQAVAALAYGAGPIAPVDKIVGPGNAYVAAAKRAVFGRVGIDSIAGPSEVLIVADGSCDPAWLAADLLAQAEHDAAAQSILIAEDDALLDAVARAVEIQLQALPRAEIAAAAWRDHGALIKVARLDDALPLVDRIAPEHLQLAMAQADGFAARVRNAGAIFLGPLTPESIGDYVGGPNHVLPTSRTARFASGLAVHDFMKRTTLIGCDAASLRALGPAAATLAEAEGLQAHARSVAIRLEALGP